jgi:2-C-methyl-D-erythritol 4-phosphate cytidylyltransferase / 2-C-methyl-D-erythritol 2,4-cyclodiphosphate synthase
VTATPPRRRLRRAQTPQGFPLAALRDAYRLGTGGTDDAEVFAAAGGEVRVVDGSTRNLKITEPLDLRIAELLLEPNP